MRIKLPQNRFQPPPIEVNKKQSDINVQHEQIEQNRKTPEIIPQAQNEPGLVVVEEGQKKKALKFRENQLSQDLAMRREKMRENGEPVMEGFEDVESNGNYNELMNKISMMDLPRQYKMKNEEIVRLSMSLEFATVILLNSSWNKIQMSESTKQLISLMIMTIMIHNLVDDTCNR